MIFGRGSKNWLMNSEVASKSKPSSADSARLKKQVAPPQSRWTMHQAAARLRRDFARVSLRTRKSLRGWLSPTWNQSASRPRPAGRGRYHQGHQLRKQSLDWAEIYSQCIPGYSQLPPASRRVAQDNLRAARRSRRNAKKRRKPPHGCFPETNSPPNVPSGPQAEPAGK